MNPERDRAAALSELAEMDADLIEDAPAARCPVRGMPERLLPRPVPLGLSREEAAEYCGVSASLFDQMVKDGRMPKPKQVNRRRIWDRNRLDAAFAALPDEDEPADNPWHRGAAA